MRFCYPFTMNRLRTPLTLFRLSNAERVLGKFLLRTDRLNGIPFSTGRFCGGLHCPRALIAFATKPQCLPILTL